MTKPEEWAIQEQIRERAYFLWCEAGNPSEGELWFWLCAEKEVRALYEDDNDTH
jgi:hypothetical protein